MEILQPELGIQQIIITINLLSRLRSLMCVLKGETRLLIHDFFHFFFIFYFFFAVVDIHHGKLVALLRGQAFRGRAAMIFAIQSRSFGKESQPFYHCLGSPPQNGHYF